MQALGTIHMEALKAARKGNIDELLGLIEKNPQLLDDFDKQDFVDSPLHEAARRGRTHFAVKVMTLKPSLGKKLNPQGFSPLDLAVLEDETITGVDEEDDGITGEDEEQESKDDKRQWKYETAKALIKLDVELIRVKGKKRMTPLHHAVMENNEDLVAEFLCACPDSIDDQTYRFQNAVHLAVENKKLEIFDMLIKWLRRRNRLGVLDSEDEDGNTLLHTAVLTGELKIVKKLVHRVHRTCRNKKKLTALDIAAQNQNTPIKSLLLRSGVRNTDHDLANDTQTLAEFVKSHEGILERAFRKYFYVIGELSLDMCGIILLVAILIVTAALQGIISPPGKFWQGDGEIPPNLKIPAGATLDIYKYIREHSKIKPWVGKTVASPHIFNEFIVGNTLAFLTGSWMIFMLIPFRVPFCISLLFFTYGYLKAMEMVSVENTVPRTLASLTWIVLSASFLLRLGIFIARTLFRVEWWMPRVSVQVTNCLYILPANRLVNSLLSMSARFKLQQQVCSIQRPKNASV